ncbi:translation initiation factor, partial [Cyathus striatus]
GFGNLAGRMDVFDQKARFFPLRYLFRPAYAPNTSHCEWSSCGRFLLTAFLSPRLRVDNGIKTWHCIGML